MRFRLTPKETIILCVLFLNLISLCSLYSSLHQGGELKNHSLLIKQVIWITICWIVLILFSRINYHYYYDFAPIIYGINIILLIAVIFVGKRVMGAQRWLSFFGFTFQPSELSKMATIFLLARIFSSQRRKGLLRGFFVPLGLILFNALLIFKQPDLGTASVLVALFFTMGLRSREKKRSFLILVSIILILAPLSWNVLKDYQKKRLIVFVNPDVDPLGAGYTIIQSKIAIGSGKVFGKGFLSGTQNQFNFLPERHTDFIFTVVAEEWGFIGSLFLLIIYWLILKNILALMEGFKDPFARLLTFGITVFFFLHIFINIGMTLGLLPVVGLPLLFVSYGGSHLLISSILLGIFLNICLKYP